MKPIYLLALLVLLAGCDEINPVSRAQKQRERTVRAAREQALLAKATREESQRTAQAVEAAQNATDGLISGLFSSQDLCGKSIVNVWQGKCVDITDGDTVRVMRDGKPIKISVESIDTPEVGQPFGKNAKQFTSDYCLGKDVMVLKTGEDRYGRTLAFIIRTGLVA